jgi:hypothetical protein
MNIRSLIFAVLTEVSNEQHKVLEPLSDDLSLLDSGLDSLCFAIAVARLEDTLELDPFETTEEFPITVGDFVRLYENAAAT